VIDPERNASTQNILHDNISRSIERIKPLVVFLQCFLNSLTIKLASPASKKAVKENVTSVVIIRVEIAFFEQFSYRNIKILTF